jgi:parvulin-like peptidyl-prolyl isomerase
MLDDLRKNQKGIIWAIAIVFVMGMAIMGIVEIFYPKPYVGKIYGQKILFQEYDRMFRFNVDQFRWNNPNQVLDEQTIQNINDQTWNQLVARTIFDRQLKRYRIRVKDADVIHKFRNDPPAELMQNPSFMTDGRFDFQKYFDIIANNPDFALALEQHIREMLPYELLERRIKDQVLVTADSVRTDWLSRNDRASGRVLAFEWSIVEPIEISEEELVAYHTRNSSKYRKEATRRYRYVNLRLAPSVEDSLRAREDIYFLHTLVVGGADFAQIAEQYSQDPGSATNGGSLGFFGRGRMVPEFEDVAFNLNIGGISAPFQSPFGWHFMKVTGNRTNESGQPEVEASHILIPIEPSDATRMNVRFTADSIHEMATRDGLERAAEFYSLEIAETMEFFQDTEFIPGVGRYPHLVKEAFSKRIGFLPEPIRQNDGSYIIVELSHRQGAHIQPLDMVRDVVRREIDREKRMAIVLERAKSFLQNYDEEEYFERASEYGFRVLDFNDILITRSIAGVGVVRELNNAIFLASEGEWTDLIHGENGHYKALVTVRNTPNMDTFYQRLEALTVQYRQTKENEHYNNWYQRVLKEANVQDLRFRYY